MSLHTHAQYRIPIRTVMHGVYNMLCHVFSASTCSLPQETYNVSDYYRNEGFCRDLRNVLRISQLDLPIASCVLQGQRVARSRVFELITFVILASNAIWTGHPCQYRPALTGTVLYLALTFVNLPGVEIEVNDAPVILQAHAAVILIESFFVLYFTLEIGLRFGAFKRSRLFSDIHSRNACIQLA